MATPNYISQHSAESVSQIPPQKTGLRSRINGIWQRNHELLRNAGSLLATTGVTSVFGFAYWIFAAREFSQSAVGYGSAAVSAMTLLGTIGMFGLGTVLIGELPRRAGNRGGLVVAALIASAIGSLVLGLGFALVVMAFGSHFVEIDGTPFRVAIFAFGVALTGATLVFDEATIGLLRGGVQLVRNVAMSVAKMAVLPVAAVVLHDAFGVGILLSWIAGTVLSLIPVVIMFRRSGSRVLHRPNWGLLKSLGKVAMAHNWLNLAITVPPKLIPVLVVVVVSPSANAAFYVAFMIVSLVFMVPTHLSTVLFAIASATPEVIAEKLRFVLRLSLGIGIPVMLVLGLGAHLALSVFGSDYARLATVPLWLMLLQYIPLLPKSQYVAVCRATGQVMKAAAILSTMAAAELAAVVIGGKMGGLDGLCYALLFESVLEGLVTAPKVLSAARGRLKLPTASTTAPSATAPAVATAAETVPMQAVGARYRYSRDSELTALMSIATSVKPDRAAYDRVTGSFRVVTFTPAASLIKNGESNEHLGRHRRLEETMIDMPALKDLPSGAQDTATSGDDATYELRQQAGIAALMALASRPVQFLCTVPLVFCTVLLAECVRPARTGARACPSGTARGRAASR
jgi:O-antigen/teichoic acid export membrane protein